MFSSLKKKHCRRKVCTSGLLDRVSQYLSDNYAPPPPPPSYHPSTENFSRAPKSSPFPGFSNNFSAPSCVQPSQLHRSIDELDADLTQALEKTFVDKLLDYIDEKSLRDAQVYKAAHLDRKLFSKIASRRSYTPSKDTCLALCFALQLSLDDTRDMLQRAEHALTHSNKRDIVIEYLLQNQIYDLFEVDEVLYQLGMKTLGS